MSTDFQLSPEIFDSLPPEAQVYIRFLEKRICQLEESNRRLEARVQELENRLAKNSSNSGKATEQ